MVFKQFLYGKLLAIDKTLKLQEGRREKLLNLEYLNKRRRLSKLLLDYIKRICIFTS